MDAVEFVKTRARMCGSTVDCRGCPALEPCNSNGANPLVAEQWVAAVEKWAAEHPIKTRQDEFLKLLPNIDLDGGGYINISPCELDTELASICPDDFVRNCTKCRREFWMQEVDK